MRKFTILLCVIAALFVIWQLIPAANLTTTTAPKTYVDTHVHTAGLGYGDSGAFINDSMRDSYKFPIYLWAMGVTEEELQQHGDSLVIDRIAQQIASAKRVKSAVILAMDGVIDATGALDREATQIYVPNDFVAKSTQQHDNLLFGASINPNRADAIERLRTVKAQGATLIKWIPNIMHIDPGNPAHGPFYEEMARLDLPLLSHAGQERSFASAIDEYGDPRRLQLPLSLGVTVIAAHIATTGEIDGLDNYEHILGMFEQHPNLYTEISSLTQANKLGYLADALQRPEVVSRMLYGTDWPLQFFPLISPYYHLNHLSLTQAKAIAAIDNPWDRDVALKETLGVPEEVFLRTEVILSSGR